jgi:hypothetical protein
MRRESFGSWRCPRKVSLGADESAGRDQVSLNSTADTSTDVSHSCRFKGRTLVIKRYKGEWAYGEYLYNISVS